MSDPYPTRSPMVNEGGGLDVRSYIELSARVHKESLETATRTLDYKVEASTKALDEKVEASTRALDEKMTALVVALDGKTEADNKRIDKKLELLVTNLTEKEAQATATLTYKTEEHARTHEREHDLVEKSMAEAKKVNDEWRHDANQWRDTLTVYMNSVPSKSDLVNVTEKIERAEAMSRQDSARVEQLLKTQMESTNVATTNYHTRLDVQLADFATWRAHMEGQRVVLVAIPTLIATLVGILAIINYVST